MENINISSYWYKEILQRFLQFVGYEEELQNDEQILEKTIFEYYENCHNLNNFYFYAGIATQQILSEAMNLGSYSISIAMIAASLFLNYIQFDAF